MNEWAFASSSEGIGFGPIGGSRKSEGNTSPRRGLSAALLYGILMIVAPLSGAVVLTWWLGAFALVFGAALIILSLKLRSRYSGRPAVAAPRPVS